MLPPWAFRYGGGVMAEFTNMDYSHVDEFEIGRGEVIGPTMTVNVVIRWYQATWDMMGSAVWSEDGEKPIKFVPVADISDEFHVAVYVPYLLFYILPENLFMTALETMVSLAGYTFHEEGPDAVSRL